MRVLPKSEPMLPWRRGAGVRQLGFTLIELIMVMVMLGVLAVFAAPRVLDMNTFNARGFHDETLSLLRYAQKTAIAQRRTVCVDVTSAAPATMRLSIAADPSDIMCGVSLAGPNRQCPGGPTGDQGCIIAPIGISYTAGPSIVQFLASGESSAAASFQVSNASSAITVEAATGYVHD